MNPIVQDLVPHHGLRLVPLLHAVQELRIKGLESHLVQVMMLHGLLRLLVEVDDFYGLYLLFLVSLRIAGSRGCRGEFLQVLLQVIPTLIGSSGRLSERSASVEASFAPKAFLAGVARKGPGAPGTPQKIYLRLLSLFHMLKFFLILCFSSHLNLLVVVIIPLRFGSQGRALLPLRSNRARRTHVERGHRRAHNRWIRRRRRSLNQLIILKNGKFVAKVYWL